MRGAGKGIHEYLLELPFEAGSDCILWVGGDGCTRYSARVWKEPAESENQYLLRQYA